MRTESGKAIPPSFWFTLCLLLAAARRRAHGRKKRQEELLRHRSGKSSDTWGALGLILVAVGMTIVNGVGAWVVKTGVEAGQVIVAERDGKIVVSDWFLGWRRAVDLANTETDRQKIFDDMEESYDREAKNRTFFLGGSDSENEKYLREAFRTRSTLDFIDSRFAAPGLKKLGETGAFPAMLGTLALLWWFVMIVFQGEGLELDLQRRRNPMWEWLFSHPVSTGAVFLAEMLAPVAANPIYVTGPFFWIFLYGLVYAAEFGMLVTIIAGLLVGVPLSLAAACLGKALEIGVTLRCAPRSRGAMIGLMSWLGYASMIGMMAAAFFAPQIIGALHKILWPISELSSWSLLGWFIGAKNDGSFSIQTGMTVCWFVAVLMISTSVLFVVWAAKCGISGNFGRQDLKPSASKIAKNLRFGRDPLYRKELLWFLRDRSAIVQAILIPLTVSGYQLFNMRGLIQGAQSAWQFLCGAAVVLGTYFLWVLGPRSLASEGPALWLAMTWPRGLEGLLKAKAWLWSMIASGVVGVVLLYAALRFPTDAWRILLVGIGWLAFGRSMAEKAVTLVERPSSSGEPDPIPKGRRWAASLGMLTFGIGILTQQWPIAIMGIVYSWLTAAAMWQNFRARLPYLYDPWSEKLPPPPTLMHAMVAISALVELGAVFTGILALFFGMERIGAVQGFSYCLCSVVVSLYVANFLEDRGVPRRAVWTWPRTGDRPGVGESAASTTPLVIGLTTGLLGGITLGLLADIYMQLVMQFPSIAEMIHKSEQIAENALGMKVFMGIAAVFFAPYAEEYLFRGLLFRALDREWGGWRAVLGSAAFFAIYHPPLAWVPVGVLGVLNALLFKRTGRLAPAVMLHMVYNAVVML